MKRKPKLLRRFAGFDVMTNVLASVGLRSKLFCRSECEAPWTIVVRRSRLSHFHIVERGSAWFEVRGRPPEALGAGDLLLVAPGQEYRLVDQPGRKTGPVIELSEADTPGQHFHLRHGTGDAVTDLICGSFSFEYDNGHPVLALLPKVMHLRPGNVADDASLQSTIQDLVAEVSAMLPGADMIVSRLMDVLFVRTLRAWVAEQSERANWLSALADRRIGPSLALIHERPADAWTVERLAKTVGLSRSIFTTRFTRVVGESPFSYITRIRMQRAAQMLRESQMSHAAIAEATGYESESSFNKAFKRHHGVTPGQFRRALNRPASSE
ncbi:MAG TPA: AraC family transcriptional regulator [Rudaea sp.]|nr:AraC family transcriptional regulator [Rudaea sp.]